MKQRLTALVLSALVVGGAFAATAKADDTPAVQDLRPVTTEAQRYWACVALDHVHVGACIENPLPDPHELPSLRGVIRDATGIRLPV